MKEKEMPTVRTCLEMKTTPILLLLNTKNADDQELSRHKDNLPILLPLETSILNI